MSLKINLQPKPCVECGYDPVFHRVERWSLMIDAATTRATRPLSAINRILTPATGWLYDVLGPPLARLAKLLKLAEFVYAPDAHASETAQCLWEEANKRGIKMYEVRPLGLPRRFFVAHYKGKTITFEGVPRPNRVQPSLAWIDNKAEMKRRFIERGFPVPRGAVCRTFDEARSVLASVSPVITKPHIGSNGRHTSAHIRDEVMLAKGFTSAKRLSPRVIVEEELHGPVFRATLVGGSVVGVLQRDPPHVTGDDVHSVRELVINENKNPLREGPVFAKIALNVSGIDYDRIPKIGEVVPFHFKVNWGVGGTSHDVTDSVHPDNTRLFEDIGNYLGDDLIGIDFIVGDIATSWKEQQKCGVIECNSLPHLGNHHFPFTGPVRNVARPVWDMVFPGSSK